MRKVALAATLLSLALVGSASAQQVGPQSSLGCRNGGRYRSGARGCGGRSGGRAVGAVGLTVVPRGTVGAVAVAGGLVGGPMEAPAT